jgi:iron-sulfur cluster assembly protein
MTVNINQQQKPAVTLTDSAINHIKEQLSSRGKGVGVRLAVAKTGCSGYSYVFDYVDEICESDKSFIVADLNIFIDKKSYPYLKGVAIDYQKQGLNHKFVFTNPNQTGECGCGESFTIDDKFTDDTP